MRALWIWVRLHGRSALALPAMTKAMGCCGPLARAHQTGNRPLIWVAVAALALAGCGSGGGAEPHPFTSSVGIASSDFKSGGRLPVSDTCDGAGRKPPLTIARVPPRAKALALIVHDPDAPGATSRTGRSTT